MPGRPGDNISRERLALRTKDAPFKAIALRAFFFFFKQQTRAFQTKKRTLLDVKFGMRGFLTITETRAYCSSFFPWLHSAGLLKARDSDTSARLICSTFFSVHLHIVRFPVGRMEKEEFDGERKLYEQNVA